MQKRPEIKPGDLVVHIGAKPNAYRIRMVCDISKSQISRPYIFFADGRKDLKSSWRVFHGWEKNEHRRSSLR